ncbi:MAG: hypothetical protein H6832_02895 [Planctomycetes bacterium]|nr:hypothetical protein [Planctomycetota bacterium]
MNASDGREIDTAAPPSRIRANDASRLSPLYPPTRVLPFAVQTAEDLERRAREALEMANAYRTRAEQESDREREELRAKIAEEASQLRQRVEAEARSENATKLAELIRAFQKAEAARAKRSELALRQLACELAKHLIGRELQTTPESILDIAKQAIPTISSRGRVTIRCTASHAQILRDAVQELERELADGGGLGIVADEGLSKDALIFETEGGDYDVTPSRRLSALSEDYANRAQDAS